MLVCWLKTPERQPGSFSGAAVRRTTRGCRGLQTWTWVPGRTLSVFRVVGIFPVPIPSKPLRPGQPLSEYPACQGRAGRNSSEWLSWIPSSIGLQLAPAPQTAGNIFLNQIWPSLSRDPAVPPGKRQPVVTKKSASTRSIGAQPVPNGTRHVVYHVPTWS